MIHNKNPMPQHPNQFAVQIPARSNPSVTREQCQHNSPPCTFEKKLRQIFLMFIVDQNFQFSNPKLLFNRMSDKDNTTIITQHNFFRYRPVVTLFPFASIRKQHKNKKQLVLLNKQSNRYRASYEHLFGSNLTRT